MGGEYSYPFLCKLRAKGRQNSAHLPRPKPSVYSRDLIRGESGEMSMLCVYVCTCKGGSNGLT